MSRVISVNVLQALGEREWKLEIELPRVVAKSQVVMGSWKEGVDSSFPDGKASVHVHFPRLCGHNGSSPVRSRAWQTLRPMSGLACKGGGLELGSQNVPDRWREVRGLHSLPRA